MIAMNNNSTDNSNSCIFDLFDNHPLSAYTSDSQPFSARTATLINVIKASVLDRDARIIVFVDTQQNAVLLRHSINHHLRSLNPKVFVGQGGDEGMSWKQQQSPLLRKFNQGIVKLLVATTVLEEGLDVQSCNLVIRYSAKFSLTGFIQSRGRARRENARFVILSTELEKLMEEDMIKRENGLNQQVLNISRQSNFLQSLKALLKPFETALRGNPERTVSNTPLSSFSTPYSRLQADLTASKLLKQSRLVFSIHPYCKQWMDGLEKILGSKKIYRGETGEAVVGFHEQLGVASIECKLESQQELVNQIVSSIPQLSPLGNPWFSLHSSKALFNLQISSPLKPINVDHPLRISRFARGWFEGNNEFFISQTFENSIHFYLTNDSIFVEQINMGTRHRFLFPFNSIDETVLGHSFSSKSFILPVTRPPLLYRHEPDASSEDDKWVRDRINFYQSSLVFVLEFQDEDQECWWRLRRDLQIVTKNIYDCHVQLIDKECNDNGNCSMLDEILGSHGIVKSSTVFESKYALEAYKSRHCQSLPDHLPREFYEKLIPVV